MTGRIEVHCHILPGIDDGCATVEESLQCARMLVAAGYSHSFCTPHVWPNNKDVTWDIVPQRVKQLQAELDRAGTPLKLLPGGEHNFRPNFTEMPADRLLNYGLLGKFVLADMWADRIPDYFEPAIKWMQSNGLTVILAHPERMKAVQDDPDLVHYFTDLGLLLQGNLQCLSDPPQSFTRRVMEQYLIADRYFLLGSDCHKPDTLRMRLDGLQVAIDLVGAAAVDRLTVENPSRLLPA